MKVLVRKNKRPRHEYHIPRETEVEIYWTPEYELNNKCYWYSPVTQTSYINDGDTAAAVLLTTLMTERRQVCKVPNV